MPLYYILVYVVDMFVCLLFLAIQKEPKSLLLLPHFFFHSIVVDESMNTDRPKQTRPFAVGLWCKCETYEGGQKHNWHETKDDQVFHFFSFFDNVLEFGRTRARLQQTPFWCAINKSAHISTLTLNFIPPETHTLQPFSSSLSHHTQSFLASFPSVFFLFLDFSLPSLNVSECVFVASIDVATTRDTQHVCMSIPYWLYPYILSARPFWLEMAIRMRPCHQSSPDISVTLVNNGWLSFFLCCFLALGPTLS